MNVLHIELGGSVYGGGAQTAYLLNGLASSKDRHALICDAESGLAGQIKNTHATVHAISCAGDADPRTLLTLFSIIRKQRPDLVHIHSRRGEFLSACASSFQGIRVVLSRRVDNPPNRIDATLKNGVYSKIIAISAAVKSILESHGIQKEKICLIPDGVDTAAYAPAKGTSGTLRRELGIPEHAVIAGVIAQLIERKGHHVLIEALSKIGAPPDELRVLFFGRGTLEKSLRRMVRDRGLDRSIIFCGFRSNLNQLIPQLDLLIHPALSEGLGVALLEASACAVPIIASRVGGIPEIVEDGETGLLAAPGNAAELAGKLRQLINSPIERGRLGIAGRRRVLEHFSTDQMIAKHERLYRSLIKQCDDSTIPEKQ